MTQTRNTTQIIGVATVAVPVTDPERALAFYGGTLGLETRRDMPFGQGLRWIEVAPAGATTTIGLAPPGDHRPGVDTGIRLATGDCEADHRDLASRGDVQPARSRRQHALHRGITRQLTARPTMSIRRVAPSTQR